MHNFFFKWPHSEMRVLNSFTMPLNPVLLFGTTGQMIAVFDSPKIGKPKIAPLKWRAILSNRLVDSTSNQDL